MLNILSSEAKHASESLVESPREGRENNLAWLARSVPAGKGPLLVLLGGIDTLSFRLRVAQSHLRHDLTPSSWSHIALVLDAETNLADADVIEISLEPPNGFGFAATSNGVQRNPISRYKSSREYPNVGVLRVDVPPENVATALDRFEKQRAALDATELILLWLAFAWGVGKAGNPLLDGHGIPSAAMVEVIVGAAGFDLTPALESRASCPEAVWQAAKWWHNYYEKLEQPPLTGSYTYPHKL